MPLAPDDDVGLLGAHHGDEGGEELRGDVAVGVDEAEIAAPPHAQARPERVALADVGRRTDRRTTLSGNPSRVKGLPSVEPSDTVMISKVMPEASSTRTICATVVRSRLPGL